MNMKKRIAVNKKESLKRKPSMSKEALRTHLESMFPKEKKLLSRRDPLLNEIVAWGTLANADSEGKGIKLRVIIGNKTFYERLATINWLVDRVKE
jgi:hypothetical protein